MKSGIYLPKHRRVPILALLLGALLLAMAGCGENALRKDYSASTLTLTDEAQLNAVELARYTALDTLDLRSMAVTPAQADELLAALDGVSILWNVPVGSAAFDSSLERITLPADAIELSNLRYFPKLAEVDASACTDYDALLSAAERYPHVAFIWQMDVCGVRASNTDETLDLSGIAITDADALETAIAYLPGLKRVVLTNTGLIEEAATLAERYPAIAFVRDIRVCGMSVSSGATTLDLSGAQSVDFDALLTELQAMPLLENVNLIGHETTLEQMRALKSAYPNVAFACSFTVFGQSVSADATELDLSNLTFASPEELLEPLSYLPKLAKVNMCGCGLSNEQMETLMAAYPNVRFVWMIKVGAWEMRTDITAFSKGNKRTFPNKMGRQTSSGKTNLYSEDLAPLKYCTDMVYLDLGHGNRITDLSILYSMPKLKVLILAINKITDITPIGSLKDLEHLEIFMNGVSDLSPLKNCTKLRNLNCCRNSLTDATPLYGMKTLKMLWIANNPHIPDEQLEQLKTELPDCKIITRASHSGDHGWRKNDLFKEYQDAFGLPATVW